jgi:hypothetical protein
VIPSQTGISDSSIVRILGEPSIPQKDRAHSSSPAKKGTAPLSGDAASSHIKVCPNCEKEMDVGYRICPHCHTYITGANDF